MELADFEPQGYRRVDATVYMNDREVVVCGTPASDDDTHNCDAMGCGLEHVLFRVLITTGAIADQGGRGG